MKIASRSRRLGPTPSLHAKWFVILRELTEADTLTATDIARRIKKTRPHVSAHLQTMERLRLVFNIYGHKQELHAKWCHKLWQITDTGRAWLAAYVPPQGSTAASAALRYCHVGLAAALGMPLAPPRPPASARSVVWK